MIHPRQRIELRATPEFFTRVEGEAKKLCLNMSSYIRMIVSAHIDSRAPRWTPATDSRPTLTSQVEFANSRQ